jgi:hypothetical protein
MGRICSMPNSAFIFPAGAVSRGIHLSVYHEERNDRNLRLSRAPVTLAHASQDNQ